MKGIEAMSFFMKGGCMAFSGRVLWENPADHSVEYCDVSFGEDGAFTIKGAANMWLEGLPRRIHYFIISDQNGLTVTVNQSHSPKINLQRDSNGIWHQDGQVLVGAQGLDDVDLQITPSTNTLAIRRLNLAIGESGEVEPLWIRFPDLTFERHKQYYTRTGAYMYLFQVPAIHFEANIETDENGVVVRYGNIWRRVS